MILFVKHIAIEGPGTLGEFLERASFQLKIIELQKGDRLPDDLTGIEAVVVLGGPMNVYEEDRYPFLKQDDIFLKRVLKDNIPLLGICLGSQLIAKACGAEVKKASTEEIGFSKVGLTNESQNDQLFKGFNGELDVFQWHEDTFDIPKDGHLLASSSVCENQAFKIGRCAYGLQFHIEVTDIDIENWIKEYFKTDIPKTHPKGKIMLDQYNNTKDRFDRQASILYGNFTRIISERKVGV